MIILNCSSAQVLMAKMLNIFFRFKPFYRLTKTHELEQRHLINGAFKVADEICDEKKGLREKSEATEETIHGEDDGYSNKPKSLINALLSPNNGLEEQEIKDEINTIIAAVDFEQFEFCF